MSRIEAGECEHMDMEWYGIDRQGNIAVFCSGGEGNLPEFVCENVERADELMEYFDKFERITDSVVVFMIQYQNYFTKQIISKRTNTYIEIMYYLYL